MAKFYYGGAITDSFRLIFNNLYVFVPMLLMSIIGLLFLPVYFKSIGFGADYYSNFELTNFLGIIFLGIIFFILAYLAYGWTFALIGQIVRKGKADLFKEFSNAPRKGFTFFLVSLIAILIVAALMAAFLILIFIGVLIFKFSNILGVLLMVLSIAVWLIALAFVALSLVYIVPLVALENLGPIRIIKASFKHFKDNKAHTLALSCILALFGIISTVVAYTILFLFTGSLSNEALMLYMLKSPFKYSIASFFSGLPSLIITLWSFAFLTIAYVRKAKKSKR